MEVICLENEAFYELIEEVVRRLNEKRNPKDDKWVSAQEAMRMLRIASKTTLQKLRDTGAIRFSHPEKKIILYDRDSLYEYLEKHIRDSF